MNQDVSDEDIVYQSERGSIPREWHMLSPRQERTQYINVTERNPLSRGKNRVESHEVKRQSFCGPCKEIGFYYTDYEKSIQRS